MENRKRDQDVKDVKIESLEIDNIKVKIRGLTPLLMEKMDMEVVEKYNKKKGKSVIFSGKDEKLEEDKIESKIHYTEDGNVGFPASGFAKGMVEVAPYTELDKKRVRSVRVLGNIIPILFKEKTINVTYGKTSGITKSPRKIVRPEFRDWSCEIEIQFNKNVISVEQIINLLNLAGFHMGIGAWRPQHDGSYGTYKVMPGEIEGIVI